KRNQDFYRQLVKTLGSKKDVVFTVLRLDGYPVAFHFGFRSGGEFFWYKPTFDIRLAHLSPGEVLLRELFAMAAREGYTGFDFLRGDDSFKTGFASSSPRNVSIVVRSRGLDRRVRQTARSVRSPLRMAVSRIGLDPALAAAREEPAMGGTAVRYAKL